MHRPMPCHGVKNHTSPKLRTWLWVPVDQAHDPAAELHPLVVLRPITTELGAEKAPSHLEVRSASLQKSVCDLARHLRGTLPFGCRGSA
jgi:hypothetical protein